EHHGLRHRDRYARGPHPDPAYGPVSVGHHAAGGPERYYPALESVAVQPSAQERSMRVVAIVAVAGLTLAACQPTAETPEQAQARIDTESAAAKRAIDSTNAEFVKHLGMGHADVLAGFYTEQAHAMPPNGPAAVGREAIKSLWGG